MALTFVAGTHTEIQFGSDPIVSGNSITLDLTRNVLTKSVFGEDYTQALGGVRGGTIDAGGHVAVEDFDDLMTVFQSDNDVAYSIQIGEADQPDDIGVYTGNFVVGSFSVTAAADGEWDWSLNGTLNGAPQWNSGSSS